MSASVELLSRVLKPDIYHYYKVQKKIRKLSLEEIKKIQWNRLKELLQYAYDTSDFYHELFNSVHLTPQDIHTNLDFEKIPIVNKKILKQNYKNVIAKGITEKEYTVSFTAGSTGEPFSFLLDNKREVPSTDAAFLLNKEYIGISPFKKYNELMIKAKPVNDIQNLNETPKRGFLYKVKYHVTSEIIGLKSSEIKEENIQSIYSLIQNYNIKGIYGYSSNIFYLAKLLKIHNLELTLRYVIPIAEGLLEQQKEFIKDVFHCPVYMDYGASECMRMGFQCNQLHGYHMDIYNYFFEYLNDKGDKSKPGETANVVVTNLNNYVFPLIRYKIGDQCIVTDKTCSCGFNYPLVNQIIGRDSDFIITPLNEEISRNDFTVCLTYLYEYISQYQLILNKSLNTIHIKIIPTKKFTTEISEKIKSDILKLIKNSMNVTIELVEKIPFEENGKTKVLILES